ncbi:11785_t:CDS:2, partial [Ambispora gerdemannii]
VLLLRVLSQLTLAKKITIDDIEINIEDFTIGHLKEHIWKKNRNDFADIDPANLKLWKKYKVLIEKPHDEIDIKRELGGNELGGFELFLDIFPADYNPPRRHIHIIIQPPTPTGPVDVSKNFYVPFEMLYSTQKLDEAIDEKVCVLLVGHFQSGKTSILHYLSDNKKNHFYIQSSMLTDGFLHGLCKRLSLNLCSSIIDLNYEILKNYKGGEIVILIDEFDRFLLNSKDTGDTIDQMKELTKCVNDRGIEGIKSIVFAGSFSITTMLEDGLSQIKKVVRMSSQKDSLSQKKQTRECLEKLVGVPSSLNSAKTIEASDFTKEQHVLFYHDIQENRNLHFSEEVMDDIFGLTNGYAGLEGLLASLCIEYASNEEILDFNTWNNRFTEFIRNPTKKKINAVKHIEKYLTEPGNDSDITTQYYNHFIKDAKKLLERFLQKGTLQSSEIAEGDLIALVHLRAIGIIKSQGDRLEFTSNIILDLLSSSYYPFYRETLAKISSIDTPLDFLGKTLDLLKYIRYDVIFHSLAPNQHSFSEQTIQGELYALLHMAVSYPTYKIFHETRTLKNYAISGEIKSAIDQAIGYTKGREGVCCMLIFNFVPSNSKPDNYQFSFPNVVKLRDEIYFEIVYILYSKASRRAKILRNGMQAEKIPFALS